MTVVAPCETTHEPSATRARRPVSKTTGAAPTDTNASSRIASPGRRDVTED